MSDIDDKILEALNNEDKEIMNSYGKELGPFGLIAESFRGKYKALVIWLFIVILIFAVILVFSAINFFSVEDIGMKLNWLAVGLTALIVVALLRLAYFIQLVQISLRREIKRLELQVSLLNKKF